MILAYLFQLKVRFRSFAEINIFNNNYAAFFEKEK
jgi:hypothetical protein